METYLTHETVRITGSEMESNCFVERKLSVGSNTKEVEDCGSGDEPGRPERRAGYDEQSSDVNWTIYITSTLTFGDELQVTHIGHISTLSFGITGTRSNISSYITTNSQSSETYE